MGELIQPGDRVCCDQYISETERKLRYGTVTLVTDVIAVRMDDNDEEWLWHPRRVRRIEQTKTIGS